MFILLCSQGEMFDLTQFSFDYTAKYTCHALPLKWVWEISSSGYLIFSTISPQSEGEGKNKGTF